MHHGEPGPCTWRAIGVMLTSVPSSRRRRWKFLGGVLIRAALALWLACRCCPGCHCQNPAAFESALDQQHVEGGAKAERAISKALANRHFDAHGAKRPSPAFATAVRSAAMSVHASAQLPVDVNGADAARGMEGPRRVVLMAMANDVALQRTVPSFVASMHGVMVTGSAAAGQDTLDLHLVLVCSSASAVELCQNLGLGDRCVHDEDMALGNKSLPFHSIGFNMIGFAKIKYILNTVSLGVDVVFMDTDILVFSDFVPRIMGMGADMAAMVEKCRVVDDKASYGGRLATEVPLFNIGVTYFRSVPSVTRCVYNWLFDMWMEVADRPRVWDQDVFRKVMSHCTKAYGVRLHALSPRHLNSYCYKPCGCNFTDEDVASKLDQGLKPAGFVSGSDGATCAAAAVARWELMHFPCGGEAEHKAQLMDKYSLMHRNAVLQR